ncbi:hypothetical protein L911_1866 [Vibrio fluvialis I21563]|nr:hypothetical protein L911_1866 [Vibrio fluvialis I21563]
MSPPQGQNDNQRNQLAQKHILKGRHFSIKQLDRNIRE